MLVLSAILLCVIAFSLFTAVVSLSKIQFTEEVTLSTIPFWGVYFPIGLHGGWTLAGERVRGTSTLGGARGVNPRWDPATVLLLVFVSSETLSSSLFVLVRRKCGS